MEGVPSLVWPADAAEPATAKVQRAAAQYLAKIPGFSSQGGALAEEVYKSLGASLTALGIRTKFLDVLRQEPTLFQCQTGRDRMTVTVSLQAENLLKRAANHYQQQQQQQ